MYFNSVYVSCKNVTEGKESQVVSMPNCASHTKTRDTVEVTLCASLSLPTDGAISIQGENISENQVF